MPEVAVGELTTAPPQRTLMGGRHQCKASLRAIASRRDIQPIGIDGIGASAIPSCVITGRINGRSRDLPPTCCLPARSNVRRIGNRIEFALSGGNKYLFGRHSALTRNPQVIDYRTAQNRLAADTRRLILEIEACLRAQPTPITRAHFSRVKISAGNPI